MKVVTAGLNPGSRPSAKPMPVARKMVFVQARSSCQVGSQFLILAS